jgi:hypothetical protein
MGLLTRRSRLAESVLPWVVCGLSLGIAAGFLLSETLGSGGHRRIGHLFRRENGRRHTPRARAGVVTSIQEALAQEPTLDQTAIEIRSRGHRGLELRGWVASRSARTLAHRVARAVSGDLEIANRLLVRGEDDRHEAEPRKDVPRPA